MKKRFTFLIAALMLLVFMMPSLAGWGQTYTLATSIAVGDEVVIVNYAVNKELSGVTTTGTTYGTAEDISNQTPSGLYPLTVVAGNTEGTYAFKTSDNKYLSWSSGNSLTTANSVTNASSWNVTISYSTYTITNAGTTARKLQYNTKDPRFACYTSSQTGLKLYKRNSSLQTSNLALTGAPVALSFDLNNNASAQVINYTTSSTGTFTVSESEYVTTVVDETNKTITVTPTAVTPSTQTITVSQTADATYYAGSVTFTVEVSDSTPTTTVTIDDSGITNTDVYVSTAAGSLSATVTSGGNAVPGATVTWSGDDDGVATISSDGTVMLVGVGTVNFTASYAGVPGQYQASSASYEMTVTSSEPYVQPTVIEAGLNNSLFGTSYSGPASGITDENPISGTQDNVTITYAGGGNHYVNNSQIRFYPNNKLTFEAPSGYEIKQIVFTASSWGITVKVGDETIDSSTKTWTGSASQVVFTGSGSSGNCQMTMATITIGLPPAQYDITYATDLTNGSFAIGNPTSAIEGASVSVATTPAVGYRLATMTYNDGTSHDVSVSNNIGSFTMPASDVTVSATFEENVAIFTDGVYSEPMTTQASFNNWYAYSKTGDQVWGYYSFYSCARVSGYFSSTNYENEDWFVSPGMLVENGKLQVSFNCAGAYGESTMILAKYSMDYPGYGDPNNYTWTEVSTTPALPYNESNLNGLESNVVICDIEGLANNTKIYFAFKYTSTNSKAGTFEIKNFTAKQYYTITVGTLENGNIDVVPSDKQVVGGTVSLGATPSENYHFVSWNIEPTVTIEEDAFTMPSANVTVNATFEEDATYTVSYSVNGSIINEFTEPVVYGQFATLWNSEYVDEYATVPTGYTFVGWSTSAGSNETVSSFSPLADATLYAVLLMDNAPAIYIKVTSLDDITAGTYFIVNAGYVLPNADATSGGPVKSDDYKITTPLSDSYSSLPVAGTEWTFTGTIYTAMTIKNNTTEHYLNVAGTSNNNQLRVNSTSEHTWSFDENGGGFSMKDNKNNRYCATYKDGSDWRSYNSATAGNYGDGGVLYLYKLTIPEITYTYIAEIDDPNEPVTLPSIEPSYLVTVESGGVLILEGPNNGDASNLIIEDGGQLIIPDNTKVKATVQKATAGSSAEKTEANNLYAISSPVDGIKISSFAQETHNVYQYYEPTSTWQEYRNASNEFDNLAIGRGYLYRSSVENIELAGDVTGGDKDGEVKYTLSYAYGVAKYKGLNLVGNPFTHDITWSDLTLENVESSGCYMLVENPADNDHGKWKAVLAASVTVKPMQAFFVQATSADASITFNNSAAKGINYANDNIMFSVKNSKCSDEAYVMFAEGHGLNKIEHRNSEIPMLYIMNNGQNYAIADMSDDTEVINIGFEAKTMGQYTFSIKTEGQYSYMHLVDKLTGEDVDMLVEDSYTFVGAPNDRKDRFVLNLNYNAANINTDSDIFAYQSGSDIIIRGDGELHVFDVMGRLVLTQRVNGVETISMQSQGVCIFKLNGMTQKIVVR